MADNEQKNESDKGSPIRLRTSPPIHITIPYRNKKASVFCTTVDDVTLPLIVTVVTVEGCIIL